MIVYNHSYSRFVIYIDENYAFSNLILFQSIMTFLQISIFDCHKFKSCNWFVS